MSPEDIQKVSDYVKEASQEYSQTNGVSVEIRALEQAGSGTSLGITPN